MEKPALAKIHDPYADWEQLVAEAAAEYSYQPLLTKKLDSHNGDFTMMTLLEIVLWKTNRYPEVTHQLLNSINALRENYTEAKARELLGILLDLKGFDLPMASTVLRFACPQHLQIIDQRVYRFITPEVDAFTKPYSKEGKIAFYFDYLENLRRTCIQYNIPFAQSDRIIYQLDKVLNANFPIKY